MNISEDKESNEFKKPHGLKGHKASQEVRDKIRKSNTGKPKKYDVWLKRRKGTNHPAYKHG